MTQDDTNPESDSKEAPKWEKRTTFKINERMKEAVTATKAVTELEIQRLRRKLDKLTYGS